MHERYEWDPLKAQENLRKHGISFEDAVDALLDPDAVAVYDLDHSVNEERFHWIGNSSNWILA